MRVYWVGVSAQRDCDGNPVAALSGVTPTGKIIDDIISRCRDGMEHEKINFIDRVLVDHRGRLRNPSKRELALGFRQTRKLMSENPAAIFVFLGNHIRSCFQSGSSGAAFENFILHDFAGSRSIFVPHPSYIRVYRFKTLPHYAARIAELLTSITPECWQA